MSLNISNTYENYIYRKKEEFELLHKEDILTKNNDVNQVNNIKYIMEQKLKKQAEIKADFIKNIYNYQNTSRNSQSLIFDNFKCEYEYQRYDIDIKQNEFLKVFYDLDDKNYDYVFTNCGMSSLFATFYALDKLSYNLNYVGNIYVETERLIDDYIQKEKNKNNKNALLIDTVCFTSLLDILKDVELNNYDLFIIDTTLYLYDDIKLIIEKLKTQNKPILLVKSHTKLDMIGNEWSKLGSICIINSNKEFMNIFMKEARIVLSFIGGFAYLEDIPLFFSNENYKKIIYDRNKIIKNNTMYIYDKLKNKVQNCEIIKPYHNLFVLIKPKKFIDYKTLENDIHTFTNNSILKGLICYADSFGLDCFGINGYYENMSATTEVIRISPSDYPIGICDQIIDEIISWLDIYLGGEENE